MFNLALGFMCVLIVAASEEISPREFQQLLVLIGLHYLISLIVAVLISRKGSPLCC